MTLRFERNPAIRAVLWDFGGVMTESPFEAFAAFERERNLPPHLLRQINSTNPDTNAWAQFERGELTLAQFSDAFAAEAKLLGHAVRGDEVVQLVYGKVRPAMVAALELIRKTFITACLTNNFKTGIGHGLPTSDDRAEQVIEILGLFDMVIESSLIGARKPESRFYQLALEKLGIAAHEAVYLDDLGINLKPARALGMTTIKVESADQALSELEQIVGMELRSQ